MIGKTKSSGHKNIILASIIFILAIFTILPMMEDTIVKATSSNITPDSSFFYGSDDLYEITKAYGDKGIDAYIKSRWTYDLLWPAVYFYFMFSVILGFRYVIKRDKLRDSIIILPIFAVTFDILENLLSTIYMANFNSPVVVLAKAASTVSALKWGFVFITFACMIYLPLKAFLLKYKSL